ncbi:MAG: resolvase domain-containing protein [Parcubacteria group bacterium LiPW_15]|nr:MAG: resolvase domain-containing protein [Parcubacteria group bacterium LiPW_15]
MFNEINYSEIEFAAYNRKSSEQDERQALSVESQVEKAVEVAERLSINLKDEYILRESKSAKKSGKRSIFEGVIKDIEKGRIQGIITWHADRLSRNAGDAGRLVDLMDEGKLKCIITYQQIFRNTPADKQMFTITCAQAKMENDNKGENVKRGLAKKRRMGYLPAMAKIGYMNDKGEKGFRKTLIDEQRFPLVKKLLEMFLTGKYSVRELHKIAVNEMGLTTVPRKRIGGKSIKLSALYRALKDPFYAGFFHGKDDEGIIRRYEVNESVPRMVTESQHRKILSLLRRPNMPRSWVYRNDFPYKKHLKCGDCGGSITAEKKVQMICKECRKKFSLGHKTACPKCGVRIKGPKSGKILNYEYYHCVKKKNPKCPGKNISESEINGFFVQNVVSRLAVSPALRDWCIDSIRVLERREEMYGGKIEENWMNRLQNVQEQRKRLVSAHINGLINKEEFERENDRIEEETATIEAKIGKKGHSTEDLRGIEKKFDLLTEIRDIIENGSSEEKMEALSILGSNLTLTKKKLSVTNDFFCSTLEKYFDVAKSKNPRFEPEKTPANKDETEVFASVRPTMLRG